MPLIRFQVKNEYGLGEPELYMGALKKEDPKALLDGVAVTGLVGILRQLGDLAEFAADVFHDLHEQVIATSARGRKMLVRLQHVEAALSPIEKAIQGQKNHIHFAYIAGSDWHANIQTEKSHLLRTDLPRFMMDSYEECRDPPRLYLLDKFDNAGAGACLKRYSDPSYFKRVLSSSELMKAEKVQREKKAQKNKKKGLRLRNGEVQRVASISRDSSSKHLSSPSSDGQSFSAENTSIFDMGLKPELATGFISFDPKTRLRFVEPVLDANPSVVSELESDELSSLKLKINRDAFVPVLHDEPNEDVIDDDSQTNSLQRRSVSRSPSVTWDEKAEIVKATSPKSCDDILVDRVLDSESLSVSSEPSNVEHETAKLVSVDQENILFDFAEEPKSVSGGNQFDEVTSETDNYMDARNTLESETETDSECKPKWQVKALSNFSCRGMELGNGRMQEMATTNSDASDVEVHVQSHSSLTKDISPKFSKLVSLESLDHLHSPHTTDFVPKPDYSVGSDICESRDLDTLRTDDFEGVNSDLSPGSCIPNTLIILADEMTCNTSKSQESPAEESDMASIKIWTNGGLFGVEPSKPLDFSVPTDTESTGCDLSSYTEAAKFHYGGLVAKSDTFVKPSERISKSLCSMEKRDVSSNILSSADQSTLSSCQLFGIKHNLVQPIDPSECSPSYHEQHNEMSVKQNSNEYVQALSQSEFDEFQAAGFHGSYVHTDEPGLRGTNIVAPGAEMPVTSISESRSNESGQNCIGISSSFPGLEHRFPSNNLQNKASVTHGSVSSPSGMVNGGLRILQETSFTNEHKERPSGIVTQTICEPNVKEKIERGLSEKSISSRSHECSSPPLEHMKISFHPMNGLETSKLKLEFPSGNLHENIEDFMFPSFQLLQGRTVPMLDSDSESDGDTFCRSCHYSSEGLLSPCSESDSELWEPDERSGSINHELPDDSHRISLSATTISSFNGFEQMTRHSIRPAGELDNLEAETGILSFQSGIVPDLSSLDSVKSSKSRPQGKCYSLSNDPTVFAMQAPNVLPPPPPLPPMQWRITKPSFASVEDKSSSIAETRDHFDGLQVQRSTAHQQQEHDAPGSPHIAEHDQKKLRLPIQPNHCVRHKGLDAREELLHQIRNKSFSLRRTVTARQTPTQGPTTSVNISQILEKANGIRQAFVGSNEMGGNDNWSDA